MDLTDPATVIALIAIGIVAVLAINFERRK